MQARSSLACDGRNVLKMRIKIFTLQFHAVSFSYNNANVLSNVLNMNINKLYIFVNSILCKCSFKLSI